MCYIKNVDTKKRVLVVDDEPAIGNVVRIKLRICGYDVTVANRGSEAISLIKREEPDLVLLDILMPDVTGFEVLAEVRKFSSVPVIIFTARREIADAALKYGANDYIAKPFDPDRLVEKVKTVLERAAQK